MQTKTEVGPIDELERMADAATPGPWGFSPPDLAAKFFAEVCDASGDMTICHLLAGDVDDRNVRFIAAANPARIKALCAEVRKLREKLNTKYWEGIRDENIMLESANTALLARVEAMRAVVDAAEHMRDAGAYCSNKLISALDKLPGGGA